MNIKAKSKIIFGGSLNMGMCFNAKENFEAVTIYMTEAGNFDILTEEEERDLFRAYKNAKGKEKDRIREKIANSNLKLVISIAKKYNGLGLDIGDLISEGNIGLLKAIDRFDVEAGTKFSTYAVWWIKQCVKRGITDKGRCVRLPVHAYEKIQKMKRFETAFSKKFDRDPSPEEIMEALELQNLDQVEALKQAAQTILSLDAEIPGTDKREGHKATLADTMVDDGDSIEDRFLEKDMQEKLHDILSCLNNREYEIIAMRFGLADNRPRTLEEISTVYGVTRERIRQIETKALRKLRNNASRLKLQEYL